MSALEEFNVTVTFCFTHDPALYPGDCGIGGEVGDYSVSLEGFWAFRFRQFAVPGGVDAVVRGNGFDQGDFHGSMRQSPAALKRGQGRLRESSPATPAAPPVRIAPDPNRPPAMPRRHGRRRLPAPEFQRAHADTAPTRVACRACCDTVGLEFRDFEVHVADHPGIPLVQWQYVFASSGPRKISTKAVCVHTVTSWACARREGPCTGQIGRCRPDHDNSVRAPAAHRVPALHAPRKCPSGSFLLPRQIVDCQGLAKIFLPAKPFCARQGLSP